MKLTSITTVFELSGEFTSEALDAQTDSIADELFDLEQSCPDLVDSAVAVDFKTRTVEISVTVQHEDLDEGTLMADAHMRSAIHAAGGATPGWDHTFHATSKSSELVSA